MSSTQDDVIYLHRCNFPLINPEKTNSIPRDNMKIINSIPVGAKFYWLWEVEKIILNNKDNKRKSKSK